MTYVKRYAPNPNHDQINAMRDREFGDYVLFDDYQALQAEIERIKSMSRFLNTAYGVNKLNADAVREAFAKLQEEYEQYPHLLTRNNQVALHIEAQGEYYANKLEAVDN